MLQKKCESYVKWGSAISNLIKISKSLLHCKSYIAEHCYMSLLQTEPFMDFLKFQVERKC